MTRTEPQFGSGEYRNDTDKLRKVDILPIVEHVTYEEGGYEVTSLASGKNFDIYPNNCQAIESEENMKINGLALSAKPLALITLGDFPLILFDRGSRAVPSDINTWEPIIDLPENKNNILVGGRYFLLGQEAFNQIGITAGAATGRTQLNAFVSFSPGEELLLGRDYREIINSDMNTRVSEKHASIAASLDGNMIRITDLSSTNGTKVELIPTS